MNTLYLVCQKPKSKGYPFSLDNSCIEKGLTHVTMYQSLISIR